MHEMIIMMGRTGWLWTMLVGLGFGVRWMILRKGSKPTAGDDAA
jgi:hypothetical protein